MKITVLGCGALGQLWLTALCKHGHEVQGWLRVPQPYCSVNLIGEDGSIFNESLTANDPDFLAQSDLLLVTLKAWQVSDAVKTLAAQLPPTSPILLLHNGMGTLDELKSVPQPLLMATTTHAARRDGNIMNADFVRLHYPCYWHYDVLRGLVAIEGVVAGVPAAVLGHLVGWALVDAPTPCLPLPADLSAPPPRFRPTRSVASPTAGAPARTPP